MIDSVPTASRPGDVIERFVVGFDDTNPDWKEAFVHPTSTHGVLIQLAEFQDK